MKVVVTEPEYKKALSVFQNTEEFQCVPAPSDEVGLAARIRETFSMGRLSLSKRESSF